MSLYVLVSGWEKGCVQDIEVPALLTEAKVYVEPSIVQ
jgi:hypothetical protein